MKGLDETRNLLCCRRPNGADDAQPTIKKAERAIERDSAASDGYARQKEFDRRVSQTLDGAHPAAEVRQEIVNTWRQVLMQRPAGRSLFLHPALLASIFAVVAIVVVFALNVHEEMRSFPGDDLVKQLMEVAGRTNESEMGVVDGPLRDMGDSLFMKGIERFNAPPQFADWPAERLLMHNVHQQPVAHFASRDRMNFFVFEEGDFDVELDPNGKWFLLENKGWVGVIRRMDGIVFIATCPGTADLLSKKVELADK